MIASFVLSALLGAAPPATGGYLVLVEPGDGDAYSPAAHALAALHDGAAVLPCNVDDAVALLKTLKEYQPRYVAFVLPPDRIDVQVAHRLLEVATNVDDDPFVDYEYAFITGRDGAAASAFVERIQAAPQREYGRRAGFFGSWEGPVVPRVEGGGAAKALKLDMAAHLIGVKDGDEQRAEKAKAAFADFATRDVLLFFSHGYPDQMVACFKAPDLRDWKVDLHGAILINCACYNGAPGRWWELNFADGSYVDRSVIDPEKSVALAVIDSGAAGYIGGIDPWHGPLANQVFLLVTDNGMSLGGASKRMYDRLALAFQPHRTQYVPMSDRRFTGEGEGNRLNNGAGMIVYGDPAFAPFEANAPRLFGVSTGRANLSTLNCSIQMQPLFDGVMNAADAMLPQARLMDYYSVRTSDVLKELKMEVYDVMALPEDWMGVEHVEVTSVKAGGKDVPTGTCQWLIEDTPDGKRLQLRLPIDAPMFGSTWQIWIAQHGLEAQVIAHKL